MDRRDFVKSAAAAAAMSGSFGALVASLVPPETPKFTLWLLPVRLEKTGADFGKRFEITSYGNVWHAEGESIIGIARTLGADFEIKTDEKESVVKLLDGNVVFGSGWRGSEASAKLWEAIAEESRFWLAIRPKNASTGL